VNEKAEVTIRHADLMGVFCILSGSMNQSKRGNTVAKAPKRAFVCNECGADYPRWQGQCSACHAWNTITEMRIAASPQVAKTRLSGLCR
jgi:hypothetical protein